MKVFFIIVIVVIVVFLFLKYGPGSKPNLDKSRPNANLKPTLPKRNDKIIVVNNAGEIDIKKVLLEFCNIYNKRDYTALPRLWQISNNKFAITFPYDIDFVTFCFMVNYLKYPMDIKWNADVRAWATATTNDGWITDKSANKKVMLFLVVDDNEYDNVFLTTEDNIGYKLGFAADEEKKLLPMPKEQYTTNVLENGNLKDLKFQDIE